jgi:hypothetical protein
MAGKSGKSQVLANPFYLVLLIASTLFVITSLGYYVAPFVLDPGQVGQVGRVPQVSWSRALAAWLDRNGPLVLGIEFVVMLVTGILAMVTDDWFAAARKPADREKS